jgi:transcriptional regulator with XRE-family HTH domain
MGNTDFSLHERITSLRNKHGLSQNEMADAAKLARRTYQNIEYKRTQQIPIDYVIAIADALAMSVDELLDRKKKQSPAKAGLRQDLEKLIVSLPDNALPDAIHRIEMLIAGLKDDKAPSSSVND